MNPLPSDSDAVGVTKLVDMPSPVRLDGGRRGWAVTFTSGGCMVTVISPDKNVSASIYEFFSGRRAHPDGFQDVIVGSIARVRQLPKP